MNRYLLILMLLILTLPILADNATNVRARQEGNTVVITYDLSAKSNVKVFFATNNSNEYKELKSVTGDVGVEISAGNNRTIIWNALDDYEKLIADGVRFKVEAKDYTPLQLTKYNISVQEWGSTEYVGVIGDKPWVIENAFGEMYSASKSGNTLVVKMSRNPKVRKREECLYIKTIDGKEKVCISLSQQGKKKCKNNIFEEYIDDWGLLEVDWWGLNAGFGTGGSFGGRLLSFRLGHLRFHPFEMFGDFQFNGRKLAYIDPSVEIFIPFWSDFPFYIGAGPSLTFSSDDMSDKPFVTKLKLTAGFRWYYGEICSSDIFFYVIGIKTYLC